MNNLIFEGIIIRIGDERTFTANNGSNHVERTIVVETEEQYPQRAAIRVIDQNAQKDFEIGKRVRCWLTLKANESDTGKWFNDIKAWRIDL